MELRGAIAEDSEKHKESRWPQLFTWVGPDLILADIKLSCPFGDGVSGSVT